MSELGWHMMAALVTYLYLGHVAVEAIGSRCHLPRLPRSVYHLACSRSRCVITLALQALSSTEPSCRASYTWMYPAFDWTLMALYYLPGDEC